MNITVSQTERVVPVTILHIQGSIDGLSYMDLVKKVEELYENGTRDLLLDLSEVPFLSSAGVVALHKVSRIMRGQNAREDDGWASIHAIDRDVENGIQKHVKLLNPQPKVESVLEVSGFNRFFEVFANLEKALGAF